MEISTRVTKSLRRGLYIWSPVRDSNSVSSSYVYGVCFPYHHLRAKSGALHLELYGAPLAELNRRLPSGLDRIRTYCFSISRIERASIHSPRPCVSVLPIDETRNKMFQVFSRKLRGALLPFSSRNTNSPLVR